MTLKATSEWPAYPRCQPEAPALPALWSNDQGAAVPIPTHADEEHGCGGRA